ncbi:XAC2610-related protein [Chryseobacterium sp. T20]|uniref:XAC2610-related protein n=1 Tax=Chryseobacterium sp. T20 TaxID=3395375 RepID=UPI0039BC5C54
MKKLFLFCFIIFSVVISAQPFILKSVGEAKEFRLTLYYGTKGKGAFVQYSGKKEIIPLQIKSFKVDDSGRSDGQLDINYYVWNEIIDGKVTGIYTFEMMHHTASNITYTRAKDNRKFKMEMMEDEKKYNGSNTYLLHAALLTFNHFYNNHFIITYSDGKKTAIELQSPDKPSFARQSIIEDYNFDGYDDIAFSVPDDGMGVYRMFEIYLYNPQSKRFEKLKEPDFSRSSCSCLCDVTVEKEKKFLITGCRGGARWHQDVYRFGKNGILEWISTKENTDE